MRGRLNAVLDDVSDLVFRPALHAAGVTDDELRRLRSQRRLTVVRRGAYVPADDHRLADAVARHALDRSGGSPQRVAGRRRQPRVRRGRCTG